METPSEHQAQSIIYYKKEEGTGNHAPLFNKIFLNTLNLDLNMKQIGSGAEAILYLEGDTVVKDRISKSYRIPEIDTKLRKARTRREAKVIEKLNLIGIPGPKLVQMDDKTMKITMSHIKGMKLRDVLAQNPAELCKEIGKKIGQMHSHGIIHADLTTSNMILDDEIYLIDFGLSFFSDKDEDKAVDLHLLDRALESRHFELYPSCWEAVLEGYKKANPDFIPVLKRLEKVENRGRNKKKN
ncbi:Kae1-associated serine/threonine protein kinase [Candidatus Woesearchaeota archaeon]|nr:Kae1-associated serine/threonine protein kinase [Candidatus Woesearchaeota archaeon]